MTYSHQIKDASTAILIQEFGKRNDNQENTKEISLKDFFEAAQSLGFFPEGRNFDAVYCDVTFDFYGVEKTITRTYSSMLEADCFGTEDLETIIKSFFDTFPEKVYWINANKIEVLHRTPKTSSVDEKWRIYVTTTGTTRHVCHGFLDTEWSEYQTSKKTALEMLLKQLEGQVLLIKRELEKL